MMQGQRCVVPGGLVLGVAWLIGCGSGGSLAIRSEYEPDQVIKGGFESGMYRPGNKGNMTILLYDGPADRPTQVMTIRMLWPPRAARTPLDPDATNATVHYVLFDAAGGVGVYRGAGYLYPSGKIGGRSLSVRLEQAALRCTDGGEGFVDPIGLARATGKFTVRRDDKAIGQLLRRINMLVSRGLGYPQLVHFDRDHLSKSAGGGR